MTLVSWDVLTADARAGVAVRVGHRGDGAAQTVLEQAPVADELLTERLFAESRVSSRPSSPAADDATAKLEALWRRVLGAPDVARDATFFEAGGDSLAAMRLVAEVRRELGVDLPLRAVLGAGSLDDLATYIRRARGEAHGAAA